MKPAPSSPPRRSHGFLAAGRRRHRPLVPAALSAVLLLPTLGARAQESATPPPAVLAPELEVQVADVATVRRLFRDNAWMKDFQASNLYRGSMARLGPVLFAVGKGEQDGWQGRLVDFVADRLLAGRPVKLSYFRAKGLVSPLGLTLAGLGVAERQAAHLIIQAQRAADDVAETVVTRTGTATVKVTPVRIRMQRFAVVEGAGCVTIARDPTVAATLAQLCDSSGTPANAVDVDLSQFFLSWSVVLDKLFGVGPTLRITFDYDAGKARFAPTFAELPLRAGHLLGGDKLPAGLLALVPAETPFLATVVIPDPRPLDTESVEVYLHGDAHRRDRHPLAITLVYLGMHTLEGNKTEAMSAILVPYDKVTEDDLAGLNDLFNARDRFEVGFSRACPGFIAISPSAAALRGIEEACQGKRPSFRQLSPRIVAALTERPSSAAVLVNFGSFLRSTLEFGYLAQAQKPQESLPPEVSDSMTLLDRLPMYAFVGTATKDALRMRGVEP